LPEKTSVEKKYIKLNISATGIQYLTIRSAADSDGVTMFSDIVLK
jgi:hypothetical protein